MEFSDKPKLISELEELREMVNQSSEYTQKQLQNIDGNLLIGTLISLILAFGTSFLLKILNYWTPASFLVIILLMIYPFYIILSMNQKDKKDVTEAISKVDRNKLNFAFYWYFSNIMNYFIIGVGLILFVAFIALLWLENESILRIQNNIINLLNIFPNKFFLLIMTFLEIIPTILKNKLTLLFLVSLILWGILILYGIIKLFTSIDYKDAFNNNLKIKKEYPIISYVISIIIIPLPFILPILGFYITYNIVSNYRFFIIVLILQLIFIFLSASYFSSLSVKKELINNLTNFSDLHYQINCLILSKNIDEEQVDKLKNEYLKAKQYEVSVYSSMFVNFYYLSINSVYINRK